MRLVGLFTSLLFICQLAVAQVTLSDHDHGRFHGFSERLEAQDQLQNGLFVEFRWKNSTAADIDGHMFLPNGAGPYNVTSTINFSRSDQPFAGLNQNQRVYPSQAAVTFQNSTAFAQHRGDQGGAAPPGVGCVFSGGVCERISVTGNAPDGIYSVGIHNFDFYDTGLGGDYEIRVFAKGGIAEFVGRGDHLTEVSTGGRLGSKGDSVIQQIQYVNNGFDPAAIGTPNVLALSGLAPTATTIAQTHQTNAQTEYLADLHRQMEALQPFDDNITPDSINWRCLGSDCYPYLKDNPSITGSMRYSALALQGAGQYMFDNPKEISSRSIVALKDSAFYLADNAGKLGTRAADTTQNTLDYAGAAGFVIETGSPLAGPAAPAAAAVGEFVSTVADAGNTAISTTRAVVSYSTGNFAEGKKFTADAGGYGAGFVVPYFSAGFARVGGDAFSFAKNSRRGIDTEQFSFSVAGGSGKNLQRSTTVDGIDIGINSGHGYNQVHKTGDVKDSGFTMDKIDNAIINDIINNKGISNLSTGQNEFNINIDGYELTYRVFKKNDTFVNVGTYFPK